MKQTDERPIRETMAVYHPNDGVQQALYLVIFKEIVLWIKKTSFLIIRK